MLPVSVFGLQTGTELVARIRYMYGTRAVDQDAANHIANSQLNVPATVTLLRTVAPQIRFVETHGVGASPYRDDLADDMVDSPVQAAVWLYDALMVSTVQPASYVRLCLPGDRMRELVDDLVASGLYDLMTLQRHNSQLG